MKEKLIKKIFVALLIVVVFCIFNSKYTVKAAITENDGDTINEEVVREEKIMKYNAKTGETTEVDMEELNKLTDIVKSRSKNGVYAIEAYTNTTNKSDTKIYTPYISLAEEPGMQVVYDTTAWPNIAVCRITVKPSLFEINYGSGALVGKNLLLTAAHCVFNKKNNNEPYTDWTCYPAYSMEAYEKLKCGWDYVYYSDNWMNTQESQYDWALCVLEEELGEKIGGYMGVQSYDSGNEMMGMDVTLYGYPSIKEINPNLTDHPLQFTTRGPITKVDVNSFQFIGKANVYGFSGGPVRTTDSIVGVFCSSVDNTSPQKGFAVRISQNIVNLILNNRT